MGADGRKLRIAAIAMRVAGFRAVKVWTAEHEPAGPRASSAYHSRLTLTFDEPGQLGPA